MTNVDTLRLLRKCKNLAEKTKEEDLYFVFFVKYRNEGESMNVIEKNICSVSFTRSESVKIFEETKAEFQPEPGTDVSLGLFCMTVTPYDVRWAKKFTKSIQCNHALMNLVKERLPLDRSLRRADIKFPYQSVEDCVLVEWRHFSTLGYNEFVGIRYGKEGETELILIPGKGTETITSILLNAEEVRGMSEEELKLKKYEKLCDKKWRWNSFSQERIKRYLKISQ